jgi:hypothetical protein
MGWPEFKIWLCSRPICKDFPPGFSCPHHIQRGSVGTSQDNVWSVQQHCGSSTTLTSWVCSCFESATGACLVTSRSPGHLLPSFPQPPRCTAQRGAVPPPQTRLLNCLRLHQPHYAQLQHQQAAFSSPLPPIPAAPAPTISALTYQSWPQAYQLSSASAATARGPAS